MLFRCPSAFEAASGINKKYKIEKEDIVGWWDENEHKCYDSQHKRIENKSCIVSLFGISCQETCCVLSLSLMSEHHCVYPGYCDAII